MAIIFKDSSGRDWDCSIGVAAVRRVVAGTGVNLANITDGAPSPLVRLSTDFIAFADVVWHLLRPQAEARGLNQEAFEQLVDTGTFAVDSCNAFWEAMQLFFQSRNQPAVVQAIRAQLRALLAAYSQLETTMQEAQIETAMATKIGELKRKANESLPGLFASSLPESPESTPTP